MTPKQLDAIWERVAKATPGPWRYETPNRDDAHMCRVAAPAEDETDTWVTIGCTWHPKVIVSYVGLSREQCMSNAALMAHAREDLPALLDWVERARYFICLVKETTETSVVADKASDLLAEVFTDAP